MQRKQREQMLDKIKDCKKAKCKKFKGHNDCIGSRNEKVSKNAKNGKNAMTSKNAKNTKNAKNAKCKKKRKEM